MSQVLADTQTPFDPDFPEQTRGRLNFPVVGIGASAGGLNALMRLFEHMPAHSGMAFVVIIHLSPEHESNAAAILQRVTRMPVMQVVERVAIEADHIYVIPPTHDLTMSDGHLLPQPSSHEPGARISIDVFFRTLAQVHRERSIAIVLSGTGSDGAVGIASVKEQGGLTLVQTPEDAEHDGMPTACIATGMIDFVMSASDMAQHLIDLWANASQIRLPVVGDDPGLKVIPEQAEAIKIADDALRDIMALLRSHSKNDFRHYKRATVLRRIERRMQVRSLPDLPSYRDYLREHPEESKPLLQDMLISVTNFFRDRDAFEALERDVMPKIFERRPQDEPVRAWIAGCATGEEAYSIAILLREQQDLFLSPPAFQVFATDIDERAISQARAGLYPEAITTDVTPGRLRQFFSREQFQLRVAKYIREKVLFAPHNVLRDPPFSRLDLICCRNLLIYLDRPAQASILEMFRFALKPGGYLFLGSSESADAAPNLFVTIDKKNRIYQTNPHAHAARPLPLLMDSQPDRAAPFVAMPLRREHPTPTFAELHRRCIEQAMSPSVLIDEKYDVLHLAEGAGRFLVHGSGTPSVNLIDNIRSELKTELRLALHQAAEPGRVAESRAVEMPSDIGPVCVKIIAQQFQESANQPRLMLVSFDEGPLMPDQPQTSGEPGQKLAIQQLETEVTQLKEHLQETIEQTETSTEELKATNEELQAINEELRSATEELETSKEELQSMNEELITVNFELKVKVDETSKINDDLHNFIASSEIATLFIDRGMRIKRFTPQATALFSLIASDLNRSLLDITHRLDYDALPQDIAEVFKNLSVVERQVTSREDHQYLARIRPYRTTDDRIDGAVLTFVDVTALRQAEKELRVGAERLKLVAETTLDYAILTIADDGTISTWNHGAESIFGYSGQEIIGQPLGTLFTPEDRLAGAPEQELQRARKDGRVEDERWHLHKDGTRFFASGVTASLGEKGVGFAKIARDMTRNKQEQTSRDEQLLREQCANELKDQFLAVMSHELKHPLNLIQVNTELLINQPDMRQIAAVTRAGKTIQRAVASQTKIIDDLLDLSRARTGKLALDTQAVNLEELVAAIVAAASESAQDKQLGLELECTTSGLQSLCDRVRTEQIVWNLVNNAIKFTPAGGKIVVRLVRDGDFARLMVMDNGKGISAEFLPQVFGMFTQALPLKSDALPKGHTAGLGVGLSLVNDLACAQGGRVLAESPGLNQGATFSVWLPLAGQVLDAAADAVEMESLAGMRLLVVDDVLELLEPFAELLRLEGAEVDAVDSGEAALQMLENKRYDVLISDIGMDGMDGYELIRQIKTRPGLATMQAIALSGYGRQVDIDRALQAGFDGHLSKPASVDCILSEIARLSRRADRAITPS